MVPLIERSYLDHNATTPLHHVARAAMLAACDVIGNPSSVHAEGRAARVVLDDARRNVAALVGTEPSGIVFTSGGTEALNLILTPDLRCGGRPFARLLVGGGEHPAVLSGHRFGEAVEIVPLTKHGQLDLEVLERQIAGKPVMLALQAANNETGVIQPVREAADLVHSHGGYVVCDAVQAIGKLPCDMKALGADALALSAHKFGGPKGVGALCFAPANSYLGKSVDLQRGVVRGGSQERGLRAGTENLIGVAGLGAVSASASERRDAHTQDWAAWRERIECFVLATVPDATVFGRGSARLPNTSCFALPQIDAQVLVMSLDLSGVAVSAGSACAAGKMNPSHVLSAMGVDPALATRALRVSLGWTTSEQDVAAFERAFAKAVVTIRPRAAA